MNNKDLIAQYVDTGVNIPEYQVIQLPNWAKKTYIRKRIIADDVTFEEEDIYVDLLSSEYERKKYANTAFRDHYSFTNPDYASLNPNLIKFLSDEIIQKLVDSSSDSRFIDVYRDELIKMGKIS